MQKGAKEIITYRIRTIGAKKSAQPKKERKNGDIWVGCVSSTAEAVKKRLPDPQTVKNAGWAAYSAVAPPIGGILRGSYNVGRSAVFTVDRAVRVEGIKRVKGSMPDKEALKFIGMAVADITIDCYSRTFTGGLPIYRTVVNGLVRTNAKAAPNLEAEELKELRDRVEQLEAMLSANGPTPPGYPSQKPVDVIRVFMMKGFTAADFVSDQVVPRHHETWRRDALLCPSSLLASSVVSHCAMMIFLLRSL